MVIRILAVALVLAIFGGPSTAMAKEPDAAGAPTDKVASDSPDTQCQLRLELLPTGGTKIHIKNVSKKSVTLVMPGDGSASHWRTPIVGYSFLPIESKAEHPKQPPRARGLLRCGNINRLRSHEVFVLKPGDAKDITEWHHCLTLPQKPGKYRIVAYYSNVPDLKWSGVPFS